MGGYWRKEGPELRKLSPELIQRAKVVSDPTYYDPTYYKQRATDGRQEVIGRGVHWRRLLVVSRQAHDTGEAPWMIARA